MTRRLFARARRERGAALIETALTLPLLLLVSVSILEFGRAYQHWQILTNAAREGARVAVLPGADTGMVEARVRAYIEAGVLSDPDTASVELSQTQVSIGGGDTASASTVLVTYPFQFIVLQPVAQLVVSQSTVGAPITMSAVATMRNE
jgi:Flp pilus assembly protein TadG